MAVGDVVSGISAVNTLLDFQPAVGVEIIITCMGMDNASDVPRLTNGTLQCAIRNISTQSTNNFLNTKICINNTNYLRLNAIAGASTCYTGIQTK